MRMLMLLEMMRMMGHRSVRHRGEPSAVSARTPRLIRAHHQLSARAPAGASSASVLRSDRAGDSIESKHKK